MLFTASNTATCTTASMRCPGAPGPSLATVSQAVWFQSEITSARAGAQPAPQASTVSTVEIARQIIIVITSSQAIGGRRSRQR
ncbi:MAG: hypothetical protein JF617_10375 [Burkholderiales bacterium]|nr:hypothetical protein [Burkholderiales bacterium]